MLVLHRTDDYAAGLGDHPEVRAQDLLVGCIAALGRAFPLVGLEAALYRERLPDWRTGP